MTPIEHLDCPTRLGHEWVVFSTVIGEGALLCQCAQCGTLGAVSDPTLEEWREAFHAPSDPYRWNDAGRVEIICLPGHARRYIEHPNAN